MLSNDVGKGLKMLIKYNYLFLLENYFLVIHF